MSDELTSEECRLEVTWDDPINEIYGDSFLLKILYEFCNLWVRRFSIVAIPPLRLKSNNSSAKQQQQRNRDVFVISMFILATLSLIVSNSLAPARSNILLQLAASFALYRAIDLFITIAKTGIFFIFRGDVHLNKEKFWRVRRILLGILLNYVELVLWFSIIYLHIGLMSPCQFSEVISSAHQAFNLSYSTMTTIGYGKYTPNEMFSEVIAFFQVLIALLMLTLVVGALLALLTRDEKAASDPDNPEIGNASWGAPILCFLICFCCAFVLLGRNYCDTVQSEVTLSFPIPMRPMVLPGG